jgi:ACS family glucarate transporter-like MFS transporter
MCLLGSGGGDFTGTAYAFDIRGALVLFIAIRFLLGAGEAVVYPASNQFVARWIPAQERGVANGWIFAGVGAGAGLSPPLITYFMLHYGWRSSFWACAIIGLVAGAVWYLTARDEPAEHPGVSASELATIRAGLPVKTELKGSGLVPWGTVLRSREVWAFTLSYFSFGYVAWIFFSWFFIYLGQVRGLNLKAVRFTRFAHSDVGVQPAGRGINDRLTSGTAPFRTMWRGRIRPGRGRNILAFGSQVDSARLASVVLAGGRERFIWRRLVLPVTADIAGKSWFMSGFMNMGAQIGGALTASLTPAIAARFGWTASFLVAAGLCLLGAAAWLVVDPTKGLTPKAIGASDTHVDVVS